MSIGWNKMLANLKESSMLRFMGHDVDNMEHDKV